MKKMFRLALLLVVPASALAYLLLTRVAYAQSPELSWPPNGWTLENLTPVIRWQSEGYSHLRVQRIDTPAPTVDMILSPGQDTYAIPAASPLQPQATYRWKVRVNHFAPESSPLTWSPWSTEWGFFTPAAPIWSAAATTQPLSPANGAMTSTITPSLSWVYPPGASQFELALTPAGNEAARTSIIRPIASSFAIPGPPEWYGMLPGNIYYWRVRASSSSGYTPPDSPSWSEWSPVMSFRTPIPPASGTISPRSPAPGERVDSLTPIIVWESRDSNLFYYEVQLSKDPQFTMDRGKATTMVYWETRHGGMTSPPDSYTIPASFPLEPNATYYWRVRPWVAGALAGANWSPTWDFTTPHGLR